MLLSSLSGADERRRWRKSYGEEPGKSERRSVRSEQTEEKVGRKPGKMRRILKLVVPTSSFQREESWEWKVGNWAVTVVDVKQKTQGVRRESRNPANE
jgi:hypothetical protein